MHNLKALYEHFPMDAISWRAQTVTKDGKKALALAYIDARDVMNRLDDVCGPEGWQCKYSHATGKTICDIGIKCGDEWVWKADGAGDTDIEAEKGAISDAFKRAAVKWGIGRYLYDLEAVWCPCESRESGKDNWGNVKWSFQKFTDDPWKHTKPEQKAKFQTYKKQNSKWEEIADKLRGVEDEKELAKVWTEYQLELAVFKRTDMEIFNQLESIKNDMKSDLLQSQGMPNGFREVTKGAANV